MLKFLHSIFDEQKKTLKKYQVLVDKTMALDEQFVKMSDKELAGQTAKLKSKIAELLSQGKTEDQALTEILPEAFATVREASSRVIGLKHFDVQLLAGVAQHFGHVTEQKTGEGKTLTVTAPLYLNALLGKGTHLVTVNDYLAEVGVGWMGPIYHFLGLSTAVIVHDQARLYNPAIDSEDRGDERLEHFQAITRQEAYAADITYGTNNEFGFDYLRDNMVQEISEMVQRSDFAHHFAIVDEADSILIDEARTPLIISAPDTEPTTKYYDFAKMVQGLAKDVDFSVEEKSKSVTLTDLGVKRIEQKLGVDNLYEESFDTIHQVESALKAKTLYHRDTEYIVREGEVIIVDEHTGRLMHGRRYSDGLHQAIEAKEGVQIQQESRTLATVSLQNYFRLYTKLAGMTGTALTEAEEFQKIYRMEALAIPTHVAPQRIDEPDLIFKTTAAKYSAIVNAVAEIHELGRPILIGTRSIEHNEIIADFLKRRKIPHQVLNAKNNEKEAFIIADAGKKNAITVATNIAGRGVDIVLGGAKPELKDFRLPNESKKYDHKAYDQAIADWKARHEEVASLGGLFVIGTERHESRRIDNQLRGRAGRQGDQGTTQFYVSLEDEIMRLFGGEQIANLMNFLKIEDDMPIQHSMVSKSLESAQVKVEGFFFDQRKRLVDFDDVMNKQREIIYKRRRRLLDISEALETGDSNETQQVIRGLKTEILGYLEQEVRSLALAHLSDHPTTSQLTTTVTEFSSIIPFDEASQKQLAASLSEMSTPEAVTDRLVEVATDTYEAKESQVGTQNMAVLEKVVLLTTIDQHWMDHLDAMDSLRDGIWLRGDKTQVLSEYKKEAFSMFEKLINSVQSTITRRIFRAQVQTQQPVSIDLRKIKTTKDSVNESLTKEVADATVPTAAANTAPAQLVSPTGFMKGFRTPKKSSQKTNYKGTKGNTSDLASALAAASKAAPGVKHEKVRRNDPCPCGSGLKYKKCGLINAPEHRG